jgi:hypothetical protein
VNRTKLIGSLKQCVCLFKRFAVMLTWHGLSLYGREYRATEEYDN